MGPAVIFVGCDRSRPVDRDTWLVMDELRARGVAADWAAWTDQGVDWSAYGLCVVRTTWDYFDRLDAFLAWTADVAGRTALWNPAGVLAWNSHKRYLLDLAARGVPVVETVVAPRGCRGPVADLAPDTAEWGTLVVKPAVSVGALGAVRGRRGSAEVEAAFRRLAEEGDVVLQPFVEAVMEGEVSAVFADGACSHAVRKVPGPGDYRVHEFYGGSLAMEPVGGEWLEVARAAVDAAPCPCLYARADLLRTPAGPAVLELELIEPALFLERAGAPAVTALAAAVEARL